VDWIGPAEDRDKWRAPVNGTFGFHKMLGKYQMLQLQYLDATVLRRGVGEIRVVVGRGPAC
jgi:hypothetical protein